jgi:hypothetical protein
MRARRPVYGYRAPVANQGRLRARKGIEKRVK